MIKLSSLITLLIVSVIPLGASLAQDLAGYEKLPLVQDRDLKGQWAVNDFCTGALISGHKKIYWAQVCSVSSGCCDGYGDVLQAIGHGVYTDVHRNVTYAIQADGNMDVTTPGKGKQIFSSKLRASNPSWIDFGPWREQ